MALNQNGPAWLFCPADRPERYEKAAAAADVVILDLEDGVAAKDREAARRALIETPLDPERTVVRINPSATADQVEWARHVLEAACDERGVFQYEGLMVDAPVLRRAERIVSFAN